MLHKLHVFRPPKDACKTVVSQDYERGLFSDLTISGTRPCWLVPHSKCMTLSCDKFSSVEVVDEGIKQYEKEQCISFWRRDSRTLASAKNRLKNLQLNDAIKFYELKYACIKGGREYKMHSPRNVLCACRQPDTLR